MTSPPHPSSTSTPEPQAPSAPDTPGHVDAQASPHAPACDARAGLRRVQRLQALRGLRARAVGASGRIAVGPARRGLKKGRGPIGLWILSPLVVLALLYIVASRWVAQAVDVEGIARREIIPQLERQIGRRIEVGRVESDLSGLTPRVTLHDIVIGRDARSPVGALFRARSATLSLDAWAILARRSTPIGAIRAIHLEAPQTDLKRGRDGKWNLLELANRGPQTTGEKPVFAWSVARGRVFLTDQTRVRNGKYLQADARELNASGRVNGARPLDFQSTSLVRVLPASKPANVRARGEVDAKFKWAIADLDASGLPLPTLAFWALEKDQARDISLRAGTARIKARIGYEAERPAAEQILAQGEASVADVNLSLRLPNREPGQGELRAQNARATMAFSNSALELRGASARVLDTPLQLKGALSWRPASTSVAQMLRGLALDVRAESTAWDIGRLRAWLPPEVRREMERSQVQTGAAWSGGLRVRGGPEDARLTGLFSMPAGSARAQGWSASWQPARAEFDVRARAPRGVVRSLRGQVEFNTSALQASRADSSGDQARAEGTRAQVQFAWRDASAQSRGQAWRLSAQGTLSGRAVEGRMAGAAFASSQTRAVWSGAGASTSGSPSARRLSWNGSLQAEGARARGTMNGGRGRAGAQVGAGAWALRLDAPAQDARRGAGAARVALWARDWSASSAGTRAQGSSVRAEVGTGAGTRTPLARVLVRGVRARDASWGQANLRELSAQFAALSSPSRTPEQNSLLAMASALQNWPRAKWRGDVSWREADGSGLRLARVAPVLARLQSAGRADGTISLPALDGPSLKRVLDQLNAGENSAGERQVLARTLALAAPGARGEVRLRGAIVDSVPVRQLAARWALEAARGEASGPTLRFASALDAASVRQALGSSSLRSRLGNDAALIDVVSGVAASGGADLLSVRGAVDVARLAEGDWRRAGVLEASTPALSLDASRLNPWLASARGRELSRSLRRGGASLRSVSGLARARLSIRSRPNALDSLGVAWELSLPRAQLRAALTPDALLASASGPSSGLIPARVEVAQARASGVGTLNLSAPSTSANRVGSGALNMRFDGVASASAARVALFTSQNASSGAAASAVEGLNGARLQNVRASTELRFSIDTGGRNGRGARASAPIWKAQLQVGRASVPLPASLRATQDVTQGAQNGAPELEVEQVRFALDSASLSNGANGALALVPRVSLRLAGGRADGSLSLNRDGSIRAQLLASNLDVASLARTAQNATRTSANAAASTWDVSGRAWSRVVVAGKWPRFVLSTQSRWLNGSVRAAGAGEWPVDVARVDASLPIDVSRIEWARLDINDARTWRGLGSVKIPEVMLWSRGARVAFAGDLARVAAVPSARATSWREAWNVSGAATLNELPLREAERVPALRALVRDADVEGALSASFSVSGVLGEPRLKGLAALRLAGALGLRADIIEAPIEAALNLEVPLASRIELARLRGSIENAPLSGSILLDGARNEWSLAVRTRELPTARLLQGAGRLPTSTYEAAGGTDSARTRAALDRLRQAPLRGGVSADVALSGTLFNGRGQLSPRPQSGTATVETSELRWRGRNVGSLSADVALDKRVLQIAGIQLFRSESRARDLARDITREVTGALALPGAGSEPVASRASLLQLTGAIPLDARSEGLELRLVSEDTALPVVLAGADELLRFLEGGAQTAASTYNGAPDEAPDETSVGDGLMDASTSASITKARRALASLPRGVRGRVALEARVSGSLAAPKASVERLVLRDAAFSTPEGEQILPTIDAAFDYNGEDRALIVRSAQAILVSSEVVAEEEVGSVDREPVRTVLRLEPGGRVELDGIVNIAGDLEGADVTLLARYVPSLRVLQEQSGARGRIDQVSFRAQGSLESPTVTGGVRASGLAFRDNTLDRLEVTQFRIGDGAFRIDRGALLLEKGEFRSRSASVDIPWTWGSEGQGIGPRREAAIRISLPVANEEFGALAGVLLPRLQRADAEEFIGLIELGGTIEEPKLSGDVLIRGGRFRVAPRTLPFDVGLEDVSGHLSFADGNRLIIDSANALRGRVVTADRISAPRTGNPLNPARSKPAAAPTQAARQDDASQTNSVDESDEISRARLSEESRPEKNEKNKVPELSGSFSVGGGVVFDLSPQVLARPIETLGSHFYDLSFSLDRAQAGEALAGLRDISLGARWKTQGARAQEGQVVRWMALARGAGSQRERVSFLDKLRRRKPRAVANDGGAALSFGALKLRADFVSGLESLARSQALPLSQAGALEDLPVQAEVREYLKASGARSLEKLLAEPPQLRFEKLRLSQRGLGSGTLDGTLTIDNSATSPPTIPRTLARRTSAPDAATKYLQPAFSSNSADEIAVSASGRNSRADWLPGFLKPIALGGAVALLQADSGAAQRAQ